MGERLEGFIDTLAMCNTSESPNGGPEISKNNDSNTTFDELEDNYSWTLVYFLLRILCNIGIIYGIFIIGYKYGKRMRHLEFLRWVNRKIFNKFGSNVQMVAGQAVVQQLPRLPFQRPIKPMKIKKKTKFIPPLHNPPSRTPHIPRS